MKVCKDCATEKPISEFYRNCKSKDGRLNRCKACHKLTPHYRSRTSLSNKRIHELTPQQLKERRVCRQKYYRDNAAKFVTNQRAYLSSQRNVVYSIRNVFNGKEYIGSTTTYRHRVSGHKSKLRRGRHPSHELQKDYDLEGLVAFEFKILYEIPNENYSDSTLRAKEKEIIESLSISGATLYNETDVIKDWSTGKRCARCKKHLLPRYFHRSSYSSSGLKSRCKQCSSDRYHATKIKET